MSGEKCNNMISIGRLAIPGRPARRVLRYLWRSFLEGAAMYGAAMHGWPNPEYLRSDVARQSDKE